MKLLAQRLPGLPGRERKCVARFAAARLSGRRYELAENLRHRLRPDFAKLRHRRNQGPAQRHRHRQTAETALERLHPPPVCPLLGRRVQQQILRDAHREPESE